jgi:hypothetical protein
MNIIKKHSIDNVNFHAMKVIELKYSTLKMVNKNFLTNLQRVLFLILFLNLLDNCDDCWQFCFGCANILQRLHKVKF